MGQTTIRPRYRSILGLVALLQHYGRREGLHQHSKAPSLDALICGASLHGIKRLIGLERLRTTHRAPTDVTDGANFFHCVLPPYGSSGASPEANAPLNRRTSIILWCRSLGEACGIDLGGRRATPSSNRRALGLIASSRRRGGGRIGAQVPRWNTQKRGVQVYGIQLSPGPHGRALVMVFPRSPFLSDAERRGRAGPVLPLARPP